MKTGNRRARIHDYLIQSIGAANDSDVGVVEDILVAQCSLAFFCGERLVREILKQMKLTQRVFVVLGELWLPSKIKKEDNQKRALEHADETNDEVLEKL